MVRPEPPAAAEVRVPEPEQVPEVAPGAVAPPASSPRPPRASQAPVSGMGLWLAWVASVGAVLLALAGLWLFRAELSVAWPPIQRLYGLLG